MENIFALTTEELKEIANNLQEKIEEGLKKDGMEISAIPTHINPKRDFEDGKILALDWGGTNFRAAIVEVKNGKPLPIEKTNIATKELNKDTTVGFDRDDLFSAMAETISELKTLNNEVSRIGYCFSYPAESLLNGDAKLLRWTKGIFIYDMPGEEKDPGNPNNIIGEPLRLYLNSYKDINAKFESIKVINDTVACLFAGLSETGFDTYAGLIVGTGTNMASLMPLDKIEKIEILNNKGAASIPVNLESGNFQPPYLTVIDDLVDAMSNNKGQQRFEKAISGGYLGEIFKTVFLHKKIEYNFNGEHLSNLIKENTDEKAPVAKYICDRSAKLVAASISGLAQVLVKQKPGIKNIGLAADGSVFWKTPGYKNLVESELETLLPDGVSVSILPEIREANLLGAAIAALS